MVPNDVTGNRIVRSDDDVIPTTPEIAESDIIKELCLYQKHKLKKRRTTTTVKIELRNRSVKAKKRSQDQKLHLPFNVLKDTVLYSDKGDEMQSIIFKYRKVALH